MKDYDYTQNGFYYITICTYARQVLFKSSVMEENDENSANLLQNKIIEKWLYELENKFNIIIDKYVIMPDHIHFILIINNDTNIYTISHMVQWFKTMSTNDYLKNVKNNILKPVNKKIWQRSYYEHVIRNEFDYKQAVEYIINNPIKWAYEKH